MFQIVNYTYSHPCIGELHILINFNCWQQPQNFHRPKYPPTTKIRRLTWISHIRCDGSSFDFMRNRWWNSRRKWEIGYFLVTAGFCYMKEQLSSTFAIIWNFKELITSLLMSNAIWHRATKDESYEARWYKDICSISWIVQVYFFSPVKLKLLQSG